MAKKESYIDKKSVSKNWLWQFVCLLVIVGLVGSVIHLVRVNQQLAADRQKYKDKLGFYTDPEKMTWYPLFLSSPYYNQNQFLGIMEYPSGWRVGEAFNGRYAFIESTPSSEETFYDQNGNSTGSAPKTGADIFFSIDAKSYASFDEMKHALVDQILSEKGVNADTLLEMHMAKLGTQPALWVKTLDYRRRIRINLYRLTGPSLQIIYNPDDPEAVNYQAIFNHIANTLKLESDKASPSPMPANQP